MEYNLRIPPQQRVYFTDPLDILIAGKREETLAQVENIFRDYLKLGVKLEFYLVGDIVTKDFFSNLFLRKFIKICIIDEKTHRSQIKIQFEDFFEKIIEFKNPAGTINRHSWDLLKKVLNSGKNSLIKIIEGEEDLLVLPLILEIPIDKLIQKFVFYGQPPITDSNTLIPEGIVIVKIDNNTKHKAQKLIDLMERY